MTCGNCGSTFRVASDNFCESCGAENTSRRFVLDWLWHRLTRRDLPVNESLDMRVLPEYDNSTVSTGE